MKDCYLQSQGHNYEKMVMKSTKDGHREEGEQNTGVRPRGDGSLQKRVKDED